MSQQTIWQYPVLWIKFIFLALSILGYLFDISVIIYHKLYRNLTAKLFLFLCLGQLILIFIPLIAIPFMTDNDFNPLNDDIGYKMCQYQGHSVLTGWLICSFISLWMSYLILAVLKGSKQVQDQFNICFIVYCIFVLAYNIIVHATFGGFESNQFYMSAFSWHYKEDEFYMFCSCKHPAYYGGYMIFDFTFVVIWIFLYIRIRYEQRKLENLGIYSNDLLLQTQWFGCLQLLLWSINLLFKFLDDMDLYPQENTTLAVLWQIPNVIYDLEGVFVTHLFLNLFKSYLVDKLPRFLFYFPSLFQKQSNYVIVFDYHFSSSSQLGVDMQNKSDYQLLE